MSPLSHGPHLHFVCDSMLYVHSRSEHMQFKRRVRFPTKPSLQQLTCVLYSVQYEQLSVVFCCGLSTYIGTEKA